MSIKHADIEHLLRQLVVPFYRIERNNPIPGGDRRWENDAEHSWSLAFLACALAPQVDPNLDVGQICQFAIAHDLVEIYAGDTSVFRKGDHLPSKKEREEKALEKIEQHFSRFPWITQTIKAYEQKDTDEALFVYALDKYIAVTYDYMDEARLFKQEKVTLEKYNQALTTHRHKAHSHPHIGKYYDEVRALLDQHPEYFHLEDPASAGAS